MTRLNVAFDIGDKNLDALIGRTAHMLMIECEPLLEMLVSRYTDIFSE